MSTQLVEDAEFNSVLAELRRLDPDGNRTRQTLRETIDQLYDGQRTGRYRWDQLYKTEKTHCGTLVEINLCRTFGFEDGNTLDFRIAGVEVDCKYSQSVGSWMIPPEAIGHLCLLLWADDAASKWSMGLVRVTNDRLSTGRNRDGKATLNSAGRAAISWLFFEQDLPPNILLQLDPNVVRRIMELPTGQKRVNEIFKVALGKIVGRGVVATLAQQSDYMKRLRSNGGARSHLSPLGIVILGQYLSHVAIARALQIDIPGSGDSISIRLVRAEASGPGVANIDGAFWRVATERDPVEKAPNLPSAKSPSE